MPPLGALRERLRLNLWLVPTLFAVGSGLLALLVLAVDRALLDRSVPIPGFGGSPEGARSIISAIAQSMLAFTGLVFSITMLVLQQASTQLSPRVMRTFLRDRGNQVVLGLFIGTLVFALLVLSQVRSPSDGVDAFAPGLSVWCGFVLLLASIAAFVWYIDHMAHAIRASTVIANIWREAKETLERLYPDQAAAGNSDPSPIRPDGHGHITLNAQRTGVIVNIDGERIVAAGNADRAVEVLQPVGTFIPHGAPLAELHGPWTGEAADAVRGAIELANERTMDQDLAFGLRQLVDIAIRALSPGTNDPTTAVQALDRIHDLLRRLADRRFPPRDRVVDGRLRLSVPTPTFEDFVGLAVDEITRAGRDQLQVVRRLRTVLDDLEATAPPARLPPIRQRRSHLDDIEADLGV